jgi:hypothetical protein
VIDLHTHSTVSDGTDPPRRIPELAAAAGLSAVALTDHDSLAGLDEAARSAADCGITLVRGCEVSCLAQTGGSMHVLAYFIEHDDGPLPDELARLRHDRVERNQRLAARLTEVGIPVDYQALVDAAGGEEGLGRPHFARYLVDNGIATSIQDAFDRWLGSGKPAYVPKARVLPGDIARLARASGGVAVLAHPLSLGLDTAGLEHVVRELAASGFVGIEAFYGRYSPEERRALAELAARTDLVATGGSDYHGTLKPDLQVGVGTGDLAVPDSVLDALAARRI